MGQIEEYSMRKIKTEEIIRNLREMCMEANYSLSGDMKKALEDACRKEESPLGCRILGQLQENMKIAGSEKIPICQDTGMAVVFVDMGQEVKIEGGFIGDAIQEGGVAGVLVVLAVGGKHSADLRPCPLRHCEQEGENC